MGIFKSFLSLSRINRVCLLATTGVHCLPVSVDTGVCKVSSDKMLTFDGVPIILPTYTSETPSSRCRVLLAHDCSQRGLFSVSGSFKLGRWAVKMVVPSYELELMPESSSMDSIRLIANGRPITLSSSTPVELPSIISLSRYSKRSAYFLHTFNPLTPTVAICVQP